MTDQMRTRSLPPPVALGARNAAGNTSCAVCRRPIAAGAREAQLPAGGWAHIHPCITRRPGQ